MCEKLQTEMDNTEINLCLKINAKPADKKHQKKD